MIHLPDRLLQKFNKVRKFIMKHCISEFVLPTGRGSVNTHTMQSWGQSQRDTGGFEGLVVEWEQGDCYATIMRWVRKGADEVTHRRQV